MTVNFNNVRKQAIYAHDKLIEKLNYSIIKNKEQYAEPNGEDYSNLKGYVLIDAREIEKELQTLRQMIGAIAMTAVEGEDEFKDVYQEVFPNEDQSMKLFNQEEETEDDE